MRRTILALTLAASAVMGAVAAQAEEVNVITDRSDFHLRPLLKQFEQTTGIKVNTVFLKEGTVMARLEQRPTEADLVIANEVSELVTAARNGLTVPYQSIAVDKAIPADLRDPNGMWAATSWRARVIYYNPAKVKVSELSTYEDLADPKWKGRVCIRSGYSTYNLNLFGAMMADLGEERTARFIEGLKANLGQKPQGNDRAQAQAIYKGVCDVAIANTYYYGLMLSNPDQRDWAMATRLFFPDQGQGGARVLIGGMAMTRTSKPEARRLMAFLTSSVAQGYMAGITYEYPAANTGEPLPPMQQSFGAGQPGIKDGAFERRSVDPRVIADNRDKVVKILDRVGFDQ